MFNILFNWCDSLNEPFCHDKNEQIIDLEIIQKEGCFASAKITLRNQVIKYRYAKVFLKEEDEIKLLFFGKVISFPLVIDGSQMKIELLAEPDNYQQQLDEFISNCNEKIKVADLSQTQNTPIVRDELFFSNSALNNPTTFLEGENNIFYWDKQTGNLSLSSIHKGKNTFNLSKNDIIKNSLKVNFSREPYGRININLSAEWIQNIYGSVDLVPVMSRLFSFHKINSFTDLSSSFPNFSKNGYYVAYKRISKINPNNLGVLTNYPITSSPIIIKKNNQKKSIQFRRFYFDGKFIVNWEYQQKRKEEVSLSIVDKKYSRSKNITINLNSIQSSKDYPQWHAYHNYSCEDKVIYKGFIYECIKDHITDNSLSEKYWKKINKVSDALADDTLSSFFATARGKNCIKYAIQKAIALINYSRRYVFIELCIDANKFWNISINDEVCLNDLTSKKIVGKVVETRLFCNDKSRLMKLVIGYASDGFIDYKNYDISISTKDVEPCLQNIIKDIYIENSPEEQQDLLLSKEFNSELEVKNFLKKHATKIKVKFHPLNIKREIKQEIKLADVEI